MKIINKLQKNTQTLKTYHLLSLPLVVTNFCLEYKLRLQNLQEKESEIMVKEVKYK